MFAVATHAAAPRLGLVYDRSQLRLLGLRVISLPLLPRVPILQRIYVSSIERKEVLVGRFRWRDGGRLTLANFHLDTAGDNINRSAQMQALSDALEPRDARPLVACGDTNCFDWIAGKAERDLASMLTPLTDRHGAVDAHATAQPPVLQPTHFFARADEPKLGQRLAVLFGSVGVDFPRRYDVVAATPRVAEAGVLTTPESDHDLVWAALRPPRWPALHRAAASRR